MARHLASIDLGTHTARLLVAAEAARPHFIRTLARKRTYILLTQGMDPSDPKMIPEAAMDQAVDAVEGLLEIARALDVDDVYAVATGVIREAANREGFLERVLRATGLNVRTVTGEEEALLTGRGVLHGLGRPTVPFLIFDLGGGSTEFLLGRPGGASARSIPLGAAVLTNAFLPSDPIRGTELTALTKHVDELIARACPRPEVAAPRPVVIGTGGTAVTLAVMAHGLFGRALTAEKVNGLVVDGQALSSLFERMKSMRLEERLALPGLDPQRAGVIVAGILVVLRILNYFDVLRLTVSMSDLLEGILISVLEGTRNGGKWDSLRFYV